MLQPYVIGIDIGTGSVKAVAFNFNAETIATAQDFYKKEENTNEQSPYMVFEHFKICLRQLIQKVGGSPNAISLSSAMHSIMAVDENGKPLTDLILWSDTRAAEIAEELRNTKEGKEIYKATGTPIHAMSPLCKIKWIKDHEPTIFAKTSKFISVKEFIWYELFGEYEIDHSIASGTGLFDVHLLKWHEGALQFAGITSQQLSNPVATNFYRRQVAKPFADDLGIKPDTTFLVGASDGCLANLGSGCINSSQAAISIGTSAAVRIMVKQPIVDPERMIFNYILDKSNFVCGGAINNGGNVIDWLLKNFTERNESSDDYEKLFSLVGTIPSGSQSLLFLPHVHGERAPHWDEKACGVYFGIRPIHTRANFLKAGLEGICFALLDVLNSLQQHSVDITQIIVSGGAAKARPLMQMLADVTGKEIILHNSFDASAIGAALLALQELAGRSDNEIKLGAVETIVPDKKNVLVYQKLFSVYQTLYPSLKEAMHSLHQLNS